MKIGELKNDGDYSIMAVEISWEETIPDYNDIVAEYAKRPIAGFRAGKIPTHIVEKKLHKQIAEDLSRRWAQRFKREAFGQSGLQPAGPLEIFDMEYMIGRPFRFMVRFLALPDFNLPDLQSLRIPVESEDPLSELSYRLLEGVSMRLPDEMVRAELAVDGNYDVKPGSEEWAAAAERVKLMLILKKIADREGIEVDESDVESRIRAKASEFGTTVEMLRDQLEQGDGRDRLREMLIAENVLGYLLEINQR